MGAAARGGAEAESHFLGRGPRSLSGAHARFARAALLIYGAAAVVAGALLVVALTTDRSHDEQQARETLLLETEVRAQGVAEHLKLLSQELRRLSQRAEVNLTDGNLEPERTLLQQAHRRSPFFTAGVAVLAASGDLLWADPPEIVGLERSFAGRSWFRQLHIRRRVSLVPVVPDRDDAILFMVCPVEREGRFDGALLGAIDLTRIGGVTVAGSGSSRAATILATREGSVVHPARPPLFAREGAWKELFGSRPRAQAEVREVRLDGRSTVVAVAPMSRGLVLLSLAERGQIYGPARQRMYGRLAGGLVLALAPLALLVLFLRRSLRVFRQTEELAVREDRLRLLGEATNVIAHEVKNALNGLRLGLDVLLGARPGAPAPNQERVAAALRKQIERLTEFTSELLIFSKGIAPRPVALDLSDFVRKVTSLAEEQARELGVELAVEVPSDDLRATADPTLLHLVVTNLVGNALDAVSGGGHDHPRVVVRLECRQGLVELRVTDNGPGVPAPVRERLFEPFVTGKPNGVGIGLALSRKIARAHGGDLVLEGGSAGATFLLTVPKESP